MKNSKYIRKCVDETHSSINFLKFRIEVVNHSSSLSRPCTVSQTMRVTIAMKIKSFLLMVIIKIMIICRNSKVYLNKCNLICLLKVSNWKKNQNFFIVLPAFSLIIWFMKSPHNFDKIVLLKILQLVFFRGLKTYFGILPLNWCISGMKKNVFDQ